ncbi:unnamed protein product [Closterium sp. NIES-64]|nr:unnamed protein product [Closterium sp. NIES-64]
MHSPCGYTFLRPVSSPATYRLARVAAHISPGVSATTVPATIPSAIVTPTAVTPAAVTPATVTPRATAKPPSISTHVLDVALGRGRPAAGIKVNAASLLSQPCVPTTSVPTTTPPTTVTPTASAKHPSISTHVLDVTRGRPAPGIKVLLEKQIEARKGSREVKSETGGSGESGGVRLGWERVGEGVTNADGRAAGLLAGGGVGAGIYRLSFATGEYLGLMHGTRVAGNAQVSSGNGGGFFSSVSMVFQVLPEQEREHFHVPLLLSPFSYSTYRGS